MRTILFLTFYLFR